MSTSTANLRVPFVAGRGTKCRPFVGTVRSPRATHNPPNSQQSPGERKQDRTTTREAPKAVRGADSHQAAPTQSVSELCTRYIRTWYLVRITFGMTSYQVCWGVAAQTPSFEFRPRLKLENPHASAYHQRTQDYTSSQLHYPAARVSSDS